MSPDGLTVNQLDSISGRIRTHRGKEYAVSLAHPAADAFPWLGDDELQALADDIAANGQKDDIIRLPDKRVVDGRNRELACFIAGKKPRYRESQLDDAEVVALIVTKNLRRRDLDTSQRAMIAAEIANLSVGRPHEANSATLRNYSQSDAAKQLGVSERSVSSAAKVKADAPELVPVVKDGKLDVHTAAKAAKLPAGNRKKIAKSPNPKVEARKQLASTATPETPPDETSNEDSTADTGVAVDEGEAFAADVETLCRELDKIVARMKSLKASPLSYSMHVDSAVAQVEAARKTLWQGRPAYPCPYCEAAKSKGCKACNNTCRVKKASRDAGLEAVGGAA